MAATTVNPDPVEKPEIAQVDYASSTHSAEKGAVDRAPGTPVDIDEGYDPKWIKSTVRKIDWRLIPPLIAMYCISSIDRKNVSLARAANNEAMQSELDLGTTRYNIVTLVFFPTYIIFEIPSQLGLRRFGPRIWLGGATFLWGCVTIGLGFSNNWSAMAAMRALLGMFESCLLPGASYLIACWYPRKQMATRSAIFYITSIAVGGLGNLLGYGISMMHGIGGYSGWRWVFLLEGALTVLIAIIGYILIIDFPDRCTFISEEQKEMIQTRIQRDRGDAEVDPMTKAKFISYFLEPKLWLFGLFFCVSTFGSYSMSYFLPRILKSLGFGNTMSQVLLAPPYVWAIIPAVVQAKVSDRFKNCRSWMLVAGCTQFIVGTCMYSQLPASSKVARYVGTFLAVGGCNANASLSLSWAQCSIRTQSKRGFTSALGIAWGGIGGILASTLFMDKEAKQGYPTGVYSVLGFNAFMFLAIIGLRLYFARKNKQADEGHVVIEGDPEFRYQL